MRLESEDAETGEGVGSFLTPVLSVAQSAMTQGKQHQAMHQPILTGWWDTVDVSCILPATRPFPW